MRILLVNYRYFISGGPEKYMFAVKSLLEDHGHEVIPFSVHSDKNVKTRYEKYFVDPIGDRNAVYYEDVKKTPKAIWQLLTRSIYSKEVEKAIRKEIKEVNPDVVYILHFVNKLSPSVIVGAKKENKPVIVRLSDYHILCPRFDFLRNDLICEECARGNFFSCIKYKCVKNSLAASSVRALAMTIHNALNVYRNVDCFVCPSKYMKDKMYEYGFKNVIHIPTFTEDITIDKYHLGVGNYGLYFGRIDTEKGVQFAIEAYKDLPDHKLVIMGDDSTDEAVRLKTLVEEEGLRNIEFIGYKTGQDLDDIIENSRFVIIPSIWYDNLPNTGLEAMKHSKPIIASNIGSLPELVKNGENGLLFEPENSEMLKRSILMLDDNDIVEQYGRNSLNYLYSKFSSDDHYLNLMRLFEKMQHRYM